MDFWFFAGIESEELAKDIISESGQIISYLFIYLFLHACVACGNSQYSRITEHKSN